MTRPTTFLGIDPAFRKGGFAVCCLDMTDRTARFLMFPFPIHFYDWIRSQEAPAVETTVVCVENSNLSDTTFARHRTGSISEQLAKSRNVGKNQAVSEETVYAARMIYGGRVIGIAPSTKGLTWTYQQFQIFVKQDRITLLDTVTKSDTDKIAAYQCARIASNQWNGFLNAATP